MVCEGAVTLWTSTAPYVSFDAHTDWPSYCETLKGGLLKKLHRNRRKLAECGAVTFEVVTESAAYHSALDWLIRNKREWLHHKGIDSHHFGLPNFDEFLHSLEGCSSSSGCMALFVLRVDKKIIAAELSSVDGSRVEAFIGSFDKEFGRYSPGKILNLDCLEWAQKNGLIYDFRMTAQAEDYKDSYKNRECGIASFEIPNTLWGKVYTWLRDFNLHRIISSGAKIQLRKNVLGSWLSG